MNVVSARSPTFAPAFRDRDERKDRNDSSAAPSLAWALLEALAYAGAFIDPSGVLASQCGRRNWERERRRGRR